MQRSGLQLIFRVAHDRQAVTKIKGHMTAFAALFIHPTGNTARLGESVHFSNELAPFHVGMQYRTFVSDPQVNSM